MPYTLKRGRSFDSRLKEILKKFPRSEKSIIAAIEDLSLHPESGDIYPGFGPRKVRKIRIPIAEYRIGKSGGLRLIYLVDPAKTLIIPLALYHKPAFHSENRILSLVLESLREIEADLLADQA